MKVLSKHDEIILSKTQLNNLSKPKNEKHIDISNNEMYNKSMHFRKQLDIKFKRKKE